MGYKKHESTWVRPHPSKKSTSITHNDLPSSTASIPEFQPCSDTQIPDSFETPVHNVPQHSDTLPSSTNVQITSEYLQQISTTIINTFTPQFVELQSQNSQLHKQNLELRDEYLSQISELRAQNLKLQAQVSQLQESSTSNSFSTSQKLSKESIREIARAVFGELQDKFKQLGEQSTKVSKDIREIGANVR